MGFSCFKWAQRHQSFLLVELLFFVFTESDFIVGEFLLKTVLREEMFKLQDGMCVFGEKNPEIVAHKLAGSSMTCSNHCCKTVSFHVGHLSLLCFFSPNSISPFNKHCRADWTSLSASTHAGLDWSLLTKTTRWSAQQLLTVWHVHYIVSKPVEHGQKYYYNIKYLIWLDESARVILEYALTSRHWYQYQISLQILNWSY